MRDDDLTVFSGRNFGGKTVSGLTDKDIRKVEEKLWKLMAKQAERYTMGDSSSLREETASELYKSVCFVIGLQLKESQSPTALLVSADVEGLFTSGLQMIERRIEQGRRLYSAACLGAPDIENVSFRDTLKSIGGFFKRYDYRLFAHQVPCDIDYQLCRPVSAELYGIEYVCEYLRRIIIENDLLRRFDRENAIRLLSAYCPDYKGLLINLYEPAAVNAVGIALAGRDVRTLDISESDRRIIKERFEFISEEKAKGELKAAAERVCACLGISEASASDYLALTALDLYPRIAAAMEHGGLSGIFISGGRPD